MAMQGSPDRPDYLLERLDEYVCVDAGSTCDIYRLTDRIVVKVYSTPRNKRSSSKYDADLPPAPESRFFERAKHHTPSAHVIQAFLWLPDAVFLPYYRNKSLEIGSTRIGSLMSLTNLFRSDVSRFFSSNNGRWGSLPGSHGSKNSA